MLAALLELAPAGRRAGGRRGLRRVRALRRAGRAARRFPRARRRSAACACRVRGEQVADDWAERWQQFHEPVLVGPARRPALGPPAVGGAAAAGAIDLVIDPGQAFGTGAHPTTRLSLELMLGLEPGGLVRRPRLRLGRAGDRGGQARLRAGDGGRPRAGRAGGHAGQRGRQRRGARPRRARQPARRAAAAGRHRGRQPDAPAAADAWRPRMDAAARRADRCPGCSTRRRTRWRRRSRRCRNGAACPSLGWSALLLTRV